MTIGSVRMVRQARREERNDHLHGNPERDHDDRSPIGVRSGEEHDLRPDRIALRRRNLKN